MSVTCTRGEIDRQNSASFADLDIPFSSKLNLRIPLIPLLVDTNILTFLCAALTLTTTISNLDIDLLTSIFPSDARSARRSDYTLYRCGLSGSLSGSVTPVRRREDTDGDGDAGVKVQIDWSLRAS
jgi:hypothetical protein